jgi:hypothetical protein
LKSHVFDHVSLFSLDENRNFITTRRSRVTWRPQLLLAVLETALVTQFLEDTHPSLPTNVAERTAEVMLSTWWTLHPEDTTLKVVLDLVLAGMHIELFDWGLRNNSVRSVEAARSGVLLDMLCGRGRNHYALLSLMGLADWGPGEHGRCSPEARALYVENCSGGKGLGRCQPVDLNMEEYVKELKSAGHMNSQSSVVGASALMDSTGPVAAAAREQGLMPNKKSMDRAPMELTRDFSDMYASLQRTEWLQPARRRSLVDCSNVEQHKDASKWLTRAARVRATAAAAVREHGYGVFQPGKRPKIPHLGLILNEKCVSDTGPETNDEAVVE